MYNVRTKKTINEYLKNGKGVIHVGANSGQERKLYNKHNLDVIWVEPIPSLFKELQENIKPFPKQKAYNYLITDKNDEVYPFHVASNFGASSSIFEIGDPLKDLHPEIHYTETLSLVSTTLSTVVQKENIEMRKYDLLVMDTQGAEMLVLEGARDLMSHFNYIRAEAQDWELYKGCCLVSEIDEFMHEHGFVELYRIVSPSGHDFDIVYRRR